VLGRKRHICVDTLGLILAVVVTAASVQDRDGGEDVLIQMKGLFHRLKLIWADGGYAGQFVALAKKRFKRVVEIVKRSDDMEGFVVLPKRWIVERTFGWFSKYRRLSKDYEVLPQNSVAMIHLAMINLMLHRIQPG
jgi:putative transposase